MFNRQKKLKQQLSQRRRRVRAKIFGTAQRPRLAVFRSLRHISAQLIDDVKQRTLVAAHSVNVPTHHKLKKTAVASAVGQLLAEKAKALKIAEVVFDRAGKQYHGRIKALAEAAREHGLKF